MEESFDWIGTTNNMSTDTIPILKYILGEKDAKVTIGKVSKASTLKSIVKASAKVRDTILSLSEYDLAIFEKVKSRYKLSNFVSSLYRFDSFS